MFESGVSGGEVAVDDSVVEERYAAEGSCQDAGSAGVAGEGVDVIVDKAMEGIEAVQAGRVNEGKAGGRSEGQAIASAGDICDLVGDEAVAAEDRLAGMAGGVEENETVGGCDVDGVAGRIGEDAVDAEDVVVLNVGAEASPVREGVRMSRPWSK